MNYFLIYLAAFPVLTIVLFWSYVYVMGVKRVRDRKTLTKLAYALSLPILVIGVFVDVLLNQLYFPYICWDFKHFGTVTSRMKKYKYGDSTKWQKKVSAFIELHIDDFEESEKGHI